MATFAERVKELREARGWTQVELAKRLNFHSSAVSQWESGQRNPSRDTLQRLASLFGVSIAYLLGETDDPSPSPTRPTAESPEAQLEYFLRGTGRLTDRDIKVILRLFEELARANEDADTSEGKP